MCILYFGERIIIFPHGSLKNRKVWQKNFLLRKYVAGNSLFYSQENPIKPDF